MLRWNDVDDKLIFGLNVKMYREPYLSTRSIKSVYFDIELDHHAYKYHGSELFMYRVLDANFVSYMEERGDLSRMKGISIFGSQDTIGTTF